VGGGGVAGDRRTVVPARRAEAKEGGAGERGSCFPFQTMENAGRATVGGPGSRTGTLRRKRAYSFEVAGGVVQPLTRDVDGKQSRAIW